MKKRLSKKSNPYEIIKNSVDNMSSLPSAKCKQTPNEIEKNSLNSEASKERFNFLRLKKIREEKVRQEKFNRKIYERKKLKLRSMFEVGEEVLVLTSRLKKKDSPGKFYKSSVDNKFYFHILETFLTTNRQKIEEKFFYWLKSSRSGRKLKFRFQREEIYAISDYFY